MMKRLGVARGLGHAVAEFRDPLRQTGNAALTGRPVASRKIEQHHLHRRPPDGVSHFIEGECIRKMKLDPLETAGRSGGKPLEKGPIEEQKGEIGGWLLPASRQLRENIEQENSSRILRMG